MKKHSPANRESSALSDSGYRVEELRQLLMMLLDETAPPTEESVFHPLEELVEEIIELKEEPLITEAILGLPEEVRPELLSYVLDSMSCIPVHDTHDEYVGHLMPAACLVMFKDESSDGGRLARRTTEAEKLFGELLQKEAEAGRLQVAVGLTEEELGLVVDPKPYNPGSEKLLSITEVRNYLERVLDVLADANAGPQSIKGIPPLDRMQEDSSSQFLHRAYIISGLLIGAEPGVTWYDQQDPQESLYQPEKPGLTGQQAASKLEQLMEGVANRVEKETGCSVKVYSILLPLSSAVQTSLLAHSAMLEAINDSMGESPSEHVH